MTLNRQRLLAGVHADEVQKLKDRGLILLREVEASGKFVKLGWDTYKKVEGPDSGSIWTVSEIDGEQWLVVRTSDDDQIIRSLVTESLNKDKMTKVAVKAAETHIGDLARIVPSTDESINRKYKGVTGDVVASYPERSKLQFDDGYTLWVENRDLQVVKRGNILDLNDTVRLTRARTVTGKVVKMTHDSVTFKSAAGQSFSARPSEIEKLTKSGDAIFLSMPDAYAPKLMREVSKMFAPTEETGVPSGEGEIPPSIKATPTEEEIAGGTAMPAGETSSVRQLAMDDLDFAVYGKRLGRRMSLNDTIVNKNTGQAGTIQDIRVDRKWGKYYMIDYGAGQVVREFETALMKVPTGKPVMPTQAPGMITELKERKPVKTKKTETIQKVADPVMDRLRGPGGPGTSGGPGRGYSGPSTVQPLTWEVHNKGDERDKKETNLMNDALDEAMDDEAMGGDVVVITLDPTTKKITLDFGDEEKEPQEQMLGEQITTPPGSPLQMSPETKTPEPSSEFEREQINVNY